MSENRIVISDTLLRLLVCIAVSSRGLTDEEWQFMRRLERELFPDEWWTNRNYFIKESAELD